MRPASQLEFETPALRPTISCVHIFAARRTKLVLFYFSIYLVDFYALCFKNEIILQYNCIKWHTYVEVNQILSKAGRGPPVEKHCSTECASDLLTFASLLDTRHGRKWNSLPEKKTIVRIKKVPKNKLSLKDHRHSWKVIEVKPVATFIFLSQLIEETRWSKH